MTRDSRDSRPRAVAGSEEDRERKRRGALRANERRRATNRTRVRDLARLKRDGLIAQGLRPLVELAEVEFREFLCQYGGVGEVSAARRAVLEDVCSLGIALRAEMGRYLATRDEAALERVATLANSRRAGLMAAGLDEKRADPLDLTDYLAKRMNGTGTVTLDAEQGGSAEGDAETLHTPAGCIEGANVNTDEGGSANVSAACSAAPGVDRPEPGEGDT